MWERNSFARAHNEINESFALSPCARRYYYTSMNIIKLLFNSLFISPLCTSLRVNRPLSWLYFKVSTFYKPKEIMNWVKKYYYQKSGDDNSHWTWNNFFIHRHIQVSFAPAIKLSHWSHRACVGISLGSMNLLICNASTLNSLEPKLAPPITQ